MNKPDEKWRQKLNWVRPSKQSRSEKTKEALLDAAEKLFLPQSADATSVAEVAKAAGVSVGAVYHHFKDKQSLLIALFDRMCAVYEATTREAVNPDRWEGAGVRDILKGYLIFSLRSEKESPGFKSASLEATKLDAARMKKFRQLNQDLFDGLAQLILARRDEIGHSDPELAVHFSIEQMKAMLVHRRDKNVAKSRLNRLSDKDFIAEVLASCEAYLKLGTNRGNGQ